LDLPHDVVSHIMGFMSVRTLLNAASTCRTLRNLAADKPLHPVMTSRSRVLHWMLLPEVASRVVSLRARCCLYGRCSFVGALPALRSLTVAFGSVRASMFRYLPDTLEHLDVHRLGACEGDVFFAKTLRRFKRLHTLKLTFKPSWDVVVLDGLDALPLRHLSIRLAPALVVRMPLAIPKVSLQSVAAFICPFEMHSEDLTLECMESVVPFDLIVTPSCAQGLRRLSLGCPHRITVPNVQHMSRLEHLHVRYDHVLMPLRHMQAMTSLRSMHLETRYGVAVAGTHAKLPREVRIKAEVGGVPLSKESVESMFFEADAPPSTAVANGAAAASAAAAAAAAP